jgi:uncharacterized membrane protein YfcA
MVKSGLTRQQAHANSVSVLLALCITSSVVCLNKNLIKINEVLPLLFYGILGAVLGTYVVYKINQVALRRIFAIFCIIAAIQMVFR